MLDVSSEFGLPAERVWLNAAHQGPLPLDGARAVEEMIEWKLQPHHLTSPGAFTDLPERLRGSLASLVDADASQVVLANSASYGLHLIANGLHFESGEEVVVAAHDFPSDVLPWLRLEEQADISVVAVESEGSLPTVDELASAIDERTRVVCLPWVHSFSGEVLDLEAVGQLCRDAGALLVVNGSQGVGAIPLSLRDEPIDALVSVGFKWLCGPYGTGFAWIGSRARSQIRPTKLYWVDALTTDDLERPGIDLRAIAESNPGSYDIFGTANFLNFAGFEAAVRLVEGVGVANIWEHNLSLASSILDGLDHDRYYLQERGDPARLSSMLFLRPRAESVGQVAGRLREAKIDVSVRNGMIRLAPHLYNTEEDTSRLIGALG